MTRKWIGIVGGAVGLAIAGTIGVVAFWGPSTTEPAPDVAAEQISEAALASAAERKVFFGHMSVGNNILSGLERLYEAKGVAPPQLVSVEPGATIPQVAESGTLVHSLIGDNGDPRGKLANFDAVLRAGLADQVDTALIKFCYVDVTEGTDVDALFQAYKSTLDALERDYPEVKFLHATVPLTVAPSGIKAQLKALLQGVDNPQRERYNDLLRATYGSDQLFDIAAVEGTGPDGTRHASLYPGYTSDGEHLNPPGSSLVAVEFLQLLTARQPT